MTTLRAVAWDIDGTLVDSEPLHHRALVAGSRACGVDLSDLPDQHFRGIHMGDVWHALRSRMPEALREADWLEAITAYYIANSAELRPLPGAVETIEALAARGVPQACVSNSHRRIVDANLDALGISRFMAFTIALDDVSAGKPDPEPYRLAAARFEFDPTLVLAVEDSRAGTESAVAAGLPVVLCGWDLGPWPDTVTIVPQVTDLLSRFER